jgi:sugar lactone lactonase YvrE
MYAFKAGFAQPSGLAFDDEAMHLYVADSESSSIRQICLLEGSVKNVVGASRDPTVTNITYCLHTYRSF